MLAGCAQPPQSPPSLPASPVQTARPAPPDVEGPVTVAEVLEVYRTQPVERTTRERCGERIAPPPARSLWSRMFSSEPSRNDVEMPAPVFVPEMACDTVAAQQHGQARYRIAYRFEGELYMVDLDHDPGTAVRVDALGRVIGSAAAP
jgi:hypothetical protein